MVAVRTTTATATSRAEGKVPLPGVHGCAPVAATRVFVLCVAGILLAVRALGGHVRTSPVVATRAVMAGASEAAERAAAAVTAVGAVRPGAARAVRGGVVEEPEEAQGVVMTMKFAVRAAVRAAMGGAMIARTLGRVRAVVLVCAGTKGAGAVSATAGKMTMASAVVAAATTKRAAGTETSTAIEGPAAAEAAMTAEAAPKVATTALVVRGRPFGGSVAEQRGI